MLYLLHGIGGNETHWSGPGAAAAILDNLIADKKAVPMIVVMPTAAPRTSRRHCSLVDAVDEARAVPLPRRPQPDRPARAPPAAGDARGGIPVAAAALRWRSSSRRMRRSSASCWLI